MICKKINKLPFIILDENEEILANGIIQTTKNNIAESLNGEVIKGGVASILKVITTDEKEIDFTVGNLNSNCDVKFTSILLVEGDTIKYRYNKNKSTFLDLLKSRYQKYKEIQELKKWYTLKFNGTPEKSEIRYWKVNNYKLKYTEQHPDGAPYNLDGIAIKYEQPLYIIVK